MKTLSALIAVIFLSACSLLRSSDGEDTAGISTDFNREVFERGGKAVVIIDEQNNVASDIKLHGKLTLSGPEGHSYTLEPQGISIFMLDAGTYTLETFRLVGAAGYLSARIRYGQRYRGGFNIYAGEVVYLGRINTHMLFAKTSSEQENDHRREIVSETVIEDAFADIPEDFINNLSLQTGQEPQIRLMQWKDTVMTGGNMSF